MFLELMSVIVLWTGISEAKDAAVYVGCETVLLDVGLKNHKREFIDVVFWTKDKSYDVVSVNAVPMTVTKEGYIMLEPGIYWSEELRVQKDIKFRVNNKDYNFDLKGSSDKIKCE